MKNKILVGAKSLAIILVILISSSHRTVIGNNTLAVSVSIPDQWKQSIIREDGDQMATFKFDNGSTAAPLFLFSVTKIPDQQWAKVKSQMPDAKLIAHKNSDIYFVQKTTKESIKGANSGLYQQVYQQLDAMIASIQISE